MWKEQVLLLALLAALFRPALSQSRLKADEIDDDCHVKTSIVLHKLKTCVKEQTKDGFRRNQLWTDVVKETMGAIMKTLREDIKSQSDQATEKLENKLEVAMKQAHDDKLEMKASMDRNLQSVIEVNKKQIEDVMKSNLEMKSTMDRTLLSVIEANKKQERDCQRTLATWPLIERNATLFFKAMGRTFYYNFPQLMTWKETRDWCSSRGMHLATLKTAEEVKQVSNTLKSKTAWGYEFWVSASDIGRSPGQFHWADGTPVLNSTWDSDQPNDFKANQETCTFINTGFKTLWDFRCSETSHTLCEVPELLATCL